LGRVILYCPEHDLQRAQPAENASVARTWKKAEHGRWKRENALEVAKKGGDDFFRLREILFRYAGVPVLSGVALDDWESLLGDSRTVERITAPMHISTSTVVFCAETGEGLMIWHKKASQWVYPGGHPEGDWNLLRSALRELKEETGLSDVALWHPADVPASVPPLVQRIDVAERTDEPAHSHVDVVYFVAIAAAAKSQIVLQTDEVSELKWIRLEAGAAGREAMEGLPPASILALRFTRDEVLPNARFDLGL
jgi:8-oxo-dGTP pyrophosphatase MutT (NUDIX family)